MHETPVIPVRPQPFPKARLTGPELLRLVKRWREGSRSLADCPSNVPGTEGGRVCPALRSRANLAVPTLRTSVQERGVSRSKPRAD